MTWRVFNLPTREMMGARLIEVDPNPELQEKLYPLLLADAGKEKVAAGLVVMVETAITNYAEVASIPRARAVLLERMDAFIKALAPDTETVADAERFWSIVLKERIHQLY